MNPPDEQTIIKVLNNCGTDKQAKSVARWLATDEGQEWLRDAMENDISEINEGKIPPVGTDQLDSLLQEILARINRRKVSRTVWTVAAALVPCLVAGALALNIAYKYGSLGVRHLAQETVTTKNGETKDIIFQDGSKVTLNAGSTLTFPKRFGLGKRAVSLNGEAVFEVAKDKRRPFTVSTDDGLKIKVTGTVFDVNAYEFNSTIRVNLYEGNVNVSFDDKVFPMEHHQILSFDRGRRVAKVSPMSERKDDLPWIQHTVAFRDTPILEVVQSLQRTFGVHIEIKDTGVLSYSFTLRSQPYESVEDILHDMESISAIKVSRDAPGSYSITKR